ncbi:MAG: hypothetical protein II857_04540 [Selenomonadaceae bacterium]|nr:hypothetical protein [Selenomonadaceae bacterium]
MNQGNDKFICPHCNSSNIGKCSVIYKNGVTKHHYTSEISGTVGNDIFNQQYFSGDMETTGISKTQLASLVSPPKKTSDITIPGIIGGLVFLGMIFPTLALVFIVIDKGITGLMDFFINKPSKIIDYVGAIVIMYFCSKYQSKRTDEIDKSYSQRYRDWCDSYFCFRCGNMFVIR